MRKREPLRLSWQGSSLGILTEVFYVAALCLAAWLIAMLVDWGVR